MPGVLMLEALTQAGAWLIRDMEDFAHSIILLKQARTIKYGSFVEPGRQLELRVELTSNDAKDCAFKGVGIDRGAGDGQRPLHFDSLQLARQKPRASFDGRLDRRGPPRPLLDSPKRLGRRAGDCAPAGSA